MSEDEPFIQIDDDWKAQAQREKEQLAAKAKASPAAGPASAGSPASATGDPGPAAGPSASAATGGPREMPKASFESLVNLMASQALMYMGAMPDAQGRAYVSLETARHQIDLLGVLEDKTRGNLSDEERRMLGSTLYELRSAYVSVSKMVRDQALGKTEPGAGG